MIRFIHTADIHFGVENYGRIDPTTGIHSRLLDFERALNFCIDYAIKEDVDFFLFCGDAYKTAHPSPTQQRLLLQCFLRLFTAKIPIVIIIGNHDNPVSFGKAHALEIFGQIPIEGFHVIAKPTSLVLTTKSGPVQIVGIPWPSKTTLALNALHQYDAASVARYMSQSVAHIIAEHAQQLDPALPAVLAGHLTVSSGIFSGSERRAIYGTDPLLMPSQLALPPYDYVALGHLHRHQELNQHGYPPIVYSGSIERVDFGERKEPKGFCSVTLHAKGSTSYEFVTTPTRPFVQIEVTLTDMFNQTEQILAAIAQHAVTDAVVKIIYYLPANIKDCVDITTVQQACRSALSIVGIIPVRAAQTKIRRELPAKDMKFSTLLASYFSSKPELAQRKDILLAKALALEMELEEKIIE